MKKNLICHVWPAKHTSMWRWNVSQLLRRMSTFNGHRFVAIAVDEQSVSADEVIKAFQGTVEPNDFLIYRNDPKLGEVVAFEDLMRRVESVDSDRVTYYFHFKGVKYSDAELRQNKVHTWSEVMYSTLLDYPGIVEDSLRKHAMTGAFLKSGNRFGQLPPSWHFAGTYFAFRNDAVFSKDNWHHITPMWWGTEEWPGRMFQRDDVDCLLHEGVAPTMRMYDRQYWKRQVNEKWHRFQVEHASLKRRCQYREVLDTIRAIGCKRVLVTGPQRSGTMIASKILAHDLGVSHIDETAFDTHDFQRFHDKARNSPQFVMQCPTMAPYVHLIPGVLVVWMHRDLQDILRSQRRIEWQPFEQVEKDRYFYHGSHEAAAIKTNAWTRFQRIAIGERAFDLDYDSLQDHPLWIDKEHRVSFAERQTHQEYPSA